LNELTDFNPFSDRFPQTLSMSAIGRLNQCCCVKLVCVLWQTEWLIKSYKAACLDPFRTRGKSKSMLLCNVPHI